MAAKGHVMSLAERQQVLAIANAPEYRDLSPRQIVPRLADTVMAATVFSHERDQNSAWLFSEAIRRHAVDPLGLTLHSDNGSAMKGSTMLATLQQLGVMPSFSRPSVSNDNPFSESLFRTLKYRTEYPAQPFASEQHAQQWVDKFVQWYNSEHLHSEIRFVTPDARHNGEEKSLLGQRKEV